MRYIISLAFGMMPLRDQLLNGEKELKFTFSYVSDKVTQNSGVIL